MLSRNLYFLRTCEGTIPLHKLIDLTSDYLNGRKIQAFITNFETTPKIYEKPVYYLNNDDSAEPYFIQKDETPKLMPKRILIINIGKDDEPK